MSRAPRRAAGRLLDRERILGNNGAPPCSSGKPAWPDEATATAALREAERLAAHAETARGSGARYVYPCDACGWWHRATHGKARRAVLGNVRTGKQRRRR